MSIINAGVKISRLNKENLVKQHNALISAKHKLTQTQLKIILSVVGKIQKDDEDFKDYCFYIKDFLDVINKESQWKENYSFIIESIKGILSKPLHIPTEKGDLICNWLAEAKMEKDSGLVKLRFAPSLKPYLLQLKEQFTVFKLKYILVLSSMYSIRVYELVKQFETTGFRLISIEEFKRILGIPNSYMINNVKNILNKAKKEISEKTDIEFTYSLKKQGRKYAFIKFNIKQKKSSKKRKQSEDKEEEYPSFEELAKQCSEKYGKDGHCHLKETKLISLPYCKFCKLKY